ncbi:S8 family serine peptidase [Porphyromonas macacae]|uniref:Thermophilic serine proteinase n=1 Tax=Porphyromonas macacae TaxID=28115 RepID=A0A379DL65_9PORP|nr:S8 family serine peptidase [Porphyromonas macacae]SUB78704.1 Thermophilic serine proteinase precursor [Porphyromonas macacae]
MRKTIISLLGALVLLSSCTDDKTMDELNSNLSPENLTEIKKANPALALALPGQVYVKMNPKTALQLQSAGNTDIQTFSVISPEISIASKRLGVKRVERLFPEDKRFAERHKKYGLDRWFVVYYDESKEGTEAIHTMNAVNDFELVEPVYPLEYDGYISSPVYTFNALPTDTDMPFNDPKLVDQWHYNNVGKAPGAVPGADIRLFDAWKVQVGKPNVIVAIIDDGVDVEHEDLKDNLWVNEKELNGQPGIDDDGNGIVDDIYGHNFVEEGVVGGHGSHVAGTVAARNNNGKGVCGVAGGNGEKESGVRLMACLAVDSRPKEQRKGSRPEPAFVYAADNGATIAQNSWGLPPNVPMGKAMQSAIDYFIDNAGKDKDGNQRADSPMKGGVVIFAAGNDNEDAPCYPATYERVIAVSAMSTNFTRSSFTNRGAWVDIMAPGGDQSRFGAAAGVLSCYPKNGYAYAQGTSMACPHVSGVAALILSEKGKPGYTDKDLKKAILSSLLPEDIDEKNPKEKGRLGRGYINASAAFDEDKHKAPEKPVKATDFKADYSSIKISWHIPKDEDDKLPLFQYLYISEKAITADDLKALTPVKLRVTATKPGAKMTYTFTNLKHTTKYSFAIVAEDRWGNKSEPEIFDFATLTNNAPLITFEEGAGESIINVAGNKTIVLNFQVTDPDGHTFKCFLEGETTGVSYTEKGGKGTIQIRSVLPGVHKFILVVRDQYMAETRKELSFRVVKTEPIRMKGAFSNLVAGLNKQALDINIKDNFLSQAEFPLSFEAYSGNESVVSASVMPDGKLRLKPVSKGVATVFLKAMDGVNTPLETTFKVRIVENSDAAVHIIYPVPVTTRLNVMLNQSIKDAKIKVVTLTGKVVMETEVKEAGKDGMIALNVAHLAPDTYRLIVESSNMARHEQLFVK